GVVPVVAAGNDFDVAGHGSISSPANASKAIAVAASTEGDAGPADEIADFSSGGPTPISLQLKPDVTAPGVDLLSSLPHNQWSEHSWSGTSMATPHVSGAAAVLKQRHPTWTVEQIKSALESTGDPVHPAGSNGEVLPTREGGGRIDLPRADAPLIFTDPTSLSFGLVKHGANTTLQLAVADAGSGPVPWTISLDPATTVRGATLAPTLPTVVPGTSVGFTLTVAADAAEGEGTGFILLTRALDTRRIPYWFRVEIPKLATEKQFTLPGPGLYGGNTAGKPSLVSSYRYPDGVLAPGLSVNLSGPEEIFRLVLKKPVANIGAVVTSHANGVRVAPRLLSAADENRLVGYPGVPVDLNPYAGFNRLVPAVAAILPAPGTFDFVFDTPAGAKPGKFTFRVWVDDITPPTVRLLTASVRRGASVRLVVTDKGSGIDGGSLQVKIDGTVGQKYSLSGGILSIPNLFTRGTHTLTVVVADFQETKNMEDVGPILPNTTTLTTSFVVR
ncbi:MAG TPA: S8 family serine peptidase, partial [Gaiellaceae bacterium]|nr:S8 family serine peptidase [Gaiellaceae bacterium]